MNSQLEVSSRSVRSAATVAAAQPCWEADAKLAKVQQSGLSCSQDCKHRGDSYLSSLVFW